VRLFFSMGELTEEQQDRLTPSAGDPAEKSPASTRAPARGASSPQGSYDYVYHLRVSNAFAQAFDRSRVPTTSKRSI